MDEDRIDSRTITVLFRVASYYRDQPLFELFETDFPEGRRAVPVFTSDEGAAMFAAELPRDVRVKGYTIRRCDPEGHLAITFKHARDFVLDPSVDSGEGVSHFRGED